MYTYTYGCSTGPFVVECQISLVPASRGYSLVAVPGFSLQGLLVLRCRGSRAHGHQRWQHAALECSGSEVVVQESSCPEACEILAPGPGMEPMSPALASEFLTTEPPGKSSALTLFGTRIQAQTLKPKPVATLMVS